MKYKILCINIVCVLLLSIINPKGFINRVSQNELQTRVWSLCWTADGSHLIAGHSNGLLSILDPTGAQETIAFGDNFVINIVSYHPTSPEKILLVLTDTYRVGGPTFLAYVNILTNNIFYNVPNTNLDKVNEITWKPNSDLISIAGFTGIGPSSFDTREYRVEIWDISTNSIVVSFNKSSNALSWSSDGGYLFSANVRSITSWDTHSWLETSVQINNVNNEGNTRDIKISPTGDNLAFIGYTDDSLRANHLQLFNMSNGQEVFSSTGTEITILAWRMDGRYLLVVDDKQILVLETSAYTWIGLEFEAMEVYSAVWSPSGNQIIYSYTTSDGNYEKIGFLDIAEELNDLIVNITVSNNQPYERATLAVGDLVFMDRDYPFTAIPTRFLGYDFIPTANDDKLETDPAFLTFTLTQPAAVYLAYDSRHFPPAWLDGWLVQPDQLEAVDQSGQTLLARNLYRKDFPANLPIALPGNAGPGWNSVMYSVIAVPTPPAFISNLSVSNGKTYELGTLAVGETVFIDRPYTFTSLPTGYVGQPYIRTANDDKLVTTPTFLTFEVAVPVTVYLAYDSRHTPPSWMSDWADTFQDLQTEDGSGLLWKNIYKKDFPPGTITIAGNSAPHQGSASYTIIVVPH